MRAFLALGLWALVLAPACAEADQLAEPVGQAGRLGIVGVLLNDQFVRPEPRAALYLPDGTPGQPLLAATVTLLNRGDGAMDILGIETDAHQELSPWVEAETPSTGWPVALGPVADAGFNDETWRGALWVSRPASGDHARATLTVLANDGTQNVVQEYGLDLYFGAPHLVLDPPELAFHDVPTGERVEQHLAVHNHGTAPLLIRRADLFGVPGFTLVEGGAPLVSSSDETGPHTFAPHVEVAPGAHLDWTVRFEPQWASPAAATLRLKSDDPGAPEGKDLKIRGNRYAPCLSAAAKPVSSPPSVAVGSRIELEITLGNCGIAPVTLSGAQLAAHSSAGFAVLADDPLLGPLPWMMPAFTPARLVVSYAPTSPSSLDANGQPIADIAVVELLSNSAEPIAPIVLQAVAVPLD